jgi:branched-chain amino acid transport system substrate-binding protein
VIATCIVGIAALVATACGSDSEGGSATKDTSGGSSTETKAPYKIGVSGEFSGPLGTYGNTITDGVKAYAAEVNAKGGIKGHKLEVTALDNAGDQARAAANTTQLITSNKVIAVLGNLLSANCTAGTPIAERNKVPMLCLSVAEQNPYVYNFGPDNSRAGDALMNATKELTKKDAPKVAFAYLTTLTDIALSKAMPDAVKKAGGTLATSQGVALTATDVSGQATAMAASKPDIVLMTLAQPAGMAKALRAAGYTGPVVWLDASGGLVLAPKDDPNFYGMSVYKFPVDGSTDTDVKAYISAIQQVAATAKDPSTWAFGDRVPAYLGAKALGDALGRCGDSCTGEKLKAQLDKTTLKLGELLDKYEYSGDDHYPYDNWFLYKITDKAAFTAKVSG